MKTNEKKGSCEWATKPMGEIHMCKPFPFFFGYPFFRFIH